MVLYNVEVDKKIVIKDLEGSGLEQWTNTNGRDSAYIRITNAYINNCHYFPYK